MAFFTALEAAQRLGVSEKTVRRWIKDGKLEATRRANNTLAIAESEIERLQLEREKYSDQVEQDQDTLAARLEALEQSHNALVERVAQLEALTINTPASRTRTPREPRPAPASRELFSVDQVLPSGIPSGSLQHYEFALLHAVNRRTFNDQLERDMGGANVAYIPRQKPNRDEVERWLTPDQQHAVILYWQERRKPYAPCAACPHIPTIEKATAQDGDSGDFSHLDL